MKMLCIHHLIPNRYINPSGAFYSWLFDPDHGGNRTTKLCLDTYLTPLVMTMPNTSKSYTLRVAYNLKNLAQSHLYSAYIHFI